MRKFSKVTINKEQNKAVIRVYKGNTGTEFIKTVIEATNGGADITLEIKNISNKDWPELASIVPCLNFGNPHKKGKSIFMKKYKENNEFQNIKTYFIGEKGFKRLKKRRIYFNEFLNDKLTKISPKREYTFSKKWPTGETNARRGFMRI